LLGGAAVLGCYALVLGSSPLIATYTTGTVASASCLAVGLLLRRGSSRQRIAQPDLLADES
jgi:hypothetical protein